MNGFIITSRGRFFYANRFEDTVWAHGISSMMYNNGVNKFVNSSTLIPQSIFMEQYDN